MSNFVWALLCSQSILNSETDNISLIEILEEINVPLKEGTEEVFYPIDFDIVISWKKLEESENSEYFVLTILAPSGKILLQAKHTLTFDDSSNRATMVFHFNGIPLSSSGIYTFKIETPILNEEYNLKMVGSVLLQVNYLPLKSFIEE